MHSVPVKFSHNSNKMQPYSVGMTKSYDVVLLSNMPSITFSITHQELFRCFLFASSAGKI